MSTATSSSKSSSQSFAIIAAAVLTICLAGGHARAGAMPDTENGRYALSPLADGVLRLDTRTGAVSTCNNSPEFTRSARTSPYPGCGPHCKVRRISMSRVPCSNSTLFLYPFLPSME